MYKKSDFQIGDRLFSIESYRGKKYKIKEHKITKIGNKYLEIKESLRHKILIKTLVHTQYTGMPWELYKTEQECKDVMEKEELYEKVYRFYSSLSRGQLSLENLRKINKIIDEIKEGEKS